MNRGEGPFGLDRSEHLARAAVDHRDRVSRRRAQGDLTCGEAGAAWEVAPVARPSQPAGRHQGLRSLAPAATEDPVVISRATERQLERRGHQVARLNTLVLVVEDRGLDRPLEELVRMAAEELVESVIPRDVDREALRAAPGPPPHLA